MNKDNKEFISHHSYALSIEHTMRYVFVLNDRGGLGGIADADYAEYHPFSAMCIALTSFYNNVDLKNRLLIDMFIDKYYFEKDKTINEIGEDATIKMVDEFNKVIDILKKSIG